MDPAWTASRKLAFVVIFATGTLFQGEAIAGVITYQQGFILNNINESYDATAGTRSTLFDTSEITGTVNLPGFDQSLGHLTGVDISFTSEFDHISYGQAFDSSAEVTGTRTESYRCGGWGSSRWCTRTYNLFSNSTFISGTANSELTIELTDPSGQSFNVSDTNILSCSQNANTSTAVLCSRPEDDLANEFNGSLSLSGIDLDVFLGVDPLVFTLTNQASFSAICDSVDWSVGGTIQNFDSCTAYNDVFWDGLVSVAYSYTPKGLDVDAPGLTLPATIAMVAGLLFAAAGRRREIPCK
ncbi:MAG: hypothetical protein V2J02_10900 [Pseudomonadales bacterium]|jgi:hypothetical protein|nr:hypothetical protein [Pseudomonadales bacterium]